jgi:aspartyl protease family protein
VVGLITVAPELDQALEPSSQPEQPGRFVIDRAPDGQFYTQGQAGGETIRLMVDPGAEQVLLSAGDAERLGFKSGEGFTRITLPALSVGPVHASQVVAVIAPDLPVSLLGRSFLSRMEVEVGPERMVLR